MSELGKIVFTTETLSIQSSDEFFIKNHLLCTLRASAVSSLRDRDNKSESWAATPKKLNKEMFARQTLSTQSTEYSLVKNYLLSALCASAVSPFLTRDNQAREWNIWSCREVF
jgi:hypothetical protein